VRRLLLVTLLLAPLPAGPLAGQSLARHDLALLDTTAGDARTRRELELGKVALDSATKTGSWPLYQAAVRHFEEAALRSPALAEPWFGLALSRLALYESGANVLYSPTQPVGQPNRSAWASHLRAALSRDPAHAGSLTSIGRVLAPQGDRLQPVWILAALARGESLGVVTPELLLVRGRLARAEGHYAEAIGAFDEYRAAGGDPSIAALEQARALAGALEFDSAVASYREGFAHLTPAGLELYRADLALIAEDSEIAGLRGIELATALPWIERFWGRRDAADVRAEGDRLREHLRRWAVAFERYRVVDPDRRVLFHEPWAPIAPCVPKDSFNLLQAGAREVSDPLDPRRNERILDDRGLMYMRHGEPLGIVWTMGAADRQRAAAEAAGERGGTTNWSELTADQVAAEIGLRHESNNDRGINTAEVWTYLIEGKVRSYMFRGSDYLGYSAATTLTSDISSPELALLRAQLDPRFLTVWSRYQTPFPPKQPIACMATVQRLAREVRADLMLGGSTDDQPLLFPTSLLPAVQVSAVGHPSERSAQAVVAYALRGDRLVPARMDSQVVYVLRWRLTAVDSTGEVHRLEGEELRTRADTLRAGEFLAGTLTLPLPPGRWQVGIAFWQPDEKTGGAVQVRDVRVDGATASLSDLIVGRENDLVRWNGVPMNPLGTWRRGSTVMVRAELRGVPAGEVRTTFEVHQLDRTSRRPALRVSGTSTAGEGVTLIERSVGLGRLGTGVYRLTLIVEGEGGLRLERSKVIEIVE
jgi:tetratricopeptide (TPR) repeat protein